MASSSSSRSNLDDEEPSTSGRAGSSLQQPTPPPDPNAVIIVPVTTNAEDLVVEELNSAVMNHDIIQAKKLAKQLESTGVDEAVAAVADPKAKRRGPLHLAARTGYVEMCKMLVKDFKCSVNAADATGATPLLFALQGLDPEAAVKYLISSHADPNKGDNRGITPLHIVAGRGNCAIAEYLLSEGALVDPLCQDGEAPLHVAARKGHTSMVKLLLEHNADYDRLSRKLHTPLVVSLSGPSLECLETLVEAGADVNAGSPVTPLAVAAGKGLDDCVNCLLRHGANPNEPDEIGKIPLEIAASKGQKECVELLFPVTIPLAKYGGMSFDEIVQHEVTEYLNEAPRANADGDAAYQQKDYALALKCYTRALKLGHDDPALYAKRSLCHLHRHDHQSAMDEAIAYRDAMRRSNSLLNMMLPGLSKLSPEQAALRWVLDYGKKFKEEISTSHLGSGRNVTDETPREEDP